PIKTRILAGAPHSIKQQIVRLDREAPLEAGEKTAALLARRLAEAGRGASAAVISDYGYGSVGKDSVAPLRDAMVASAAILLDSRPAPIPWSRRRRPSSPPATACSTPAAPPR